MSSRKTLFMETTEVPAERSAAEISSLLMQAGATEISQSFHGGKVIGLRFVIPIHGLFFVYEMPVRVDEVHAVLRGRTSRFVDREKAGRIAWRQLFRWLQAQLALIQIGLSNPQEVFLPYCMDQEGQTAYQRFFETSVRPALPAPKEPVQ